MITKAKLKHEIVAMLLAMIYFAIWIIGMLVVKDLILVDYDLPLAHLSIAIMGSLILAKVVVLMEPVSFGSWVRKQPAWVDVVLRTFVFGLGVIIVLILEKGIEGMRHQKGFIESVTDVFRSESAPHLWLNTLCVSSALLVYNMAGVVRRHLGKGRMLKLFACPLPEKDSDHR